MLRITSPLPDKLEALVAETIGCCIRVHTAMGPGLLESIYRKAVCIELELAGIRFEQEKTIDMSYRGQFLGKHRLDLVVADQIVLELKAIDRLANVHRAQVLGYLRASGCRIGILINFNVAVLGDGLKRFVL